MRSLGSLTGVRLRLEHVQRALQMVWRAAPGLSALALGLTLLLVGIQSFRAANADPVRSLRTE